MICSTCNKMMEDITAYGDESRSYLCTDCGRVSTQLWSDTSRRKGKPFSIDNGIWSNPPNNLTSDNRMATHNMKDSEQEELERNRDV